jgi:hypothetical protein
MRRIRICILAKYWNDQIKEDERDSACSIYEAEEKCVQSFGRNPWKRPLGRLVSNGIKISKWILKDPGCEGVGCNHLAQGRNQ